MRNVFDGLHNDEGMYEMRIESFLRGVYDGIFLWVAKRHWKGRTMYAYGGFGPSNLRMSILPQSLRYIL